MKPDQAKWTRFRIMTIFGMFLSAWVGLAWRTADLQIHERDRYVKIAESEFYKKIKLVPVRGDIYDRHKEKLAASLRVDSIYAVPAKMEDRQATANRLAKALDMDPRMLFKRFSKNSYFVWIKRQVDPDEAAQVKSLKLKGINFFKESKRFYPNVELASHVLGFVGVDSQGLEGLEVLYDGRLKAEQVYLPILRDGLKRNFQEGLSNSNLDVKGASIILTIDHRIQYAVEKALAKAQKKYNAKNGMAVVIRPSTGEVLAMAVSPSYNPNSYRRWGPDRWRNRVVTDIFDPGSTFKIFLVAAALEEKVVNPEDLINCESGELIIGARTIHDSRPFGWLTVDQVVKYSSNIGAVKISQILGESRLYDYLTAFGFGSKTNIDLPGESSGLLRTYKKWTEIDAANIAFGQGVSVTGIQLVTAMAALANGGKLMRPYIVSKIVDSSGNLVHETRPKMVRRVISEETALKVRRMLRQAVEAGGTGTMAEPVGYRAAGKTGTAQKLDSDKGIYSNEKYFSSFVGFMPYDRPELAVFVALDEPGPIIFGGIVAGPIFKEIGEKVLPLLDIAPQKEAPIMSRPKEDKRLINLTKTLKSSVKPG